jgi:hypothetical protein
VTHVHPHTSPEPQAFIRSPLPHDLWPPSLESLIPPLVDLPLTNCSPVPPDLTHSNRSSLAQSPPFPKPPYHPSTMTSLSRIVHPRLMISHSWIAHPCPRDLPPPYHSPSSCDPLSWITHPPPPTCMSCIAHPTLFLPLSNLSPLPVASLLTNHSTVPLIQVSSTRGAWLWAGWLCKVVALGWGGVPIGWGMSENACRSMNVGHKEPTSIGEDFHCFWGSCYVRSHCHFSHVGEYFQRDKPWNHEIVCWRIVHADRCHLRRNMGL